MNYTAMEVFNLVLVLVVIPLLVFVSGFVIGRLSGAKNLDMIRGSLWRMKGKRDKIDEELQKIENVIGAIQRGSE